MKAFADLYRRIESATSIRAKQTALVEAFSAAKADPAQWASAAWMVYFLAGGKPRQTVPTRLLRRLAVEGSGLPEWPVEESYSNVGDLAETLALLLPEGAATIRPRSITGCASACCRCRRSTRNTLRAAHGLGRGAAAGPAARLLQADHRRIAGRRVAAPGVKALADVAGVDESRMAQRMIGYAQARRIPSADDFAALVADVDLAEGQALDAGRPFPSISRSPGSARWTTWLRSSARRKLDRRVEVRRHPR